MQTLIAYSDLIIVLLTLILFVVGFYYYETLNTKFVVRYQFPGGVEESYNARLSGTSLIWKRGKRNYETEVKTKGRSYKKYGVSYSIFTVHHGNESETTVLNDPTYPDPYDKKLKLSASSKLEADIKESGMVSDLVAGMTSISIMDRVIMLLLGLFVGFPIWLLVMGYIQVG